MAILIISIVEAGWFLLEGVRALTTGNYYTPKAGKYKGQLGPWAKVVGAVGINPQSAFMRSTFLIIGIVWFFFIICFALQVTWAWLGMLIMPIITLWYLPIGTLLSLMQIIILLYQANRDK
jgi:hypothetical protein